MLKILQHVLIAWIVGDHQQKVIRRFDYLAELVDGQQTAMIGQRMNDHGGVLARFDDFIEITNAADFDRTGRAVRRSSACRPRRASNVQLDRWRLNPHDKRPSPTAPRRSEKPPLLAAFEAVFDDGQRLAQFPRHVFDKPRLCPFRSAL